MTDNKNLNVTVGFNKTLMVLESWLQKCFPIDMDSDIRTSRSCAPIFVGLACEENRLRVLCLHLKENFVEKLEKSVEARHRRLIISACAYFSAIITSTLKCAMN